MLPLLPLALGVGAVAGGVNAVRSAIYLRQAKRDLRDLKRNPISPYSVSPQMQQYYSQALDETRNAQGVSAAERGAFNQNLALQTNSLYNNAVSMSGGNLARALRGALNASSLGQVNQFAQFDARQKQANRQSAFGRLGMATSTMQRIKNMNEQANIDAQRALGEAIRTQRENIGNAISSIGGVGQMVGGYGLGTNNFGQGFRMGGQRYNAPSIYTIPQNPMSPFPDYSGNYTG